MNIIKNLKTLPLLGTLALSILITPGLSAASDKDRGRHNNQYSQYERHTNNHGQQRQHRRHHNDHRQQHAHRGREHHGHNHHYRAPVARVFNHSSQRRHGHAHGNRHTHRHGHNAHHTHTSRAYHPRHWLNMNNLRLMLGVHTDNFDLILRD